MRSFNLVKSLRRVNNIITLPFREGRGVGRMLILCLSLAVFGVDSAWGAEATWTVQVGVKDGKGGTAQAEIWKKGTFSDDKEEATNPSTGEMESVSKYQKATILGSRYGKFIATAAEGYSFQDWYDTNGTAQNKGTTFSTSASNKTLTWTYYAKFTPIPYNITYAGIDGATHSNSSTYTVEDAITFSPASKTGYTFKGWNPASIAKGSTGDKSTTASWTANQYQVSFDVNGGNCITPAAITVTYDGKYGQLPSPVDPEKSLIGWFTEKEGGTQITSDTDVKITTAQTLYAHWSARYSYVKAYVTPEQAKGKGKLYVSSGSVTDISNVPSWNDEDYGGPNAGLTHTYYFFAKDDESGYTFTGWTADDPSKTPESSSKSHRASVTARAEASSSELAKQYPFNFYAHFRANSYTVQFNGNGNTGGSTANQSFNYDETKALTANGFEKKYTVTLSAHGGTGVAASMVANATFDGWATSESGEKVYDDKQSVSNLTKTDKTTVNLYAHWTAGTVTLPLPVREGYAFAGWWTAETGGTKIGDAGATYTPTANITLHAQWTGVTVTAPADQTISFTAQTQTQKATLVFPVANVTNGNSDFNTPTLSGDAAWTLDSWNYANNQVTIIVSFTATENTTTRGNHQSSVTLTAKDGASASCQVTANVQLTPVYTNTFAASYLVGATAIDLNTLWTSSSNGTKHYEITSFTSSGSNNEGATAPAISGTTLSLGQAGTVNLKLTQDAGTSSVAGSATYSLTIKKHTPSLTWGTQTLYHNSTYSHYVTIANVDNTSLVLYSSDPLVANLQKSNDKQYLDLVTLTKNASTELTISQVETYYFAPFTEKRTITPEYKSDHVPFTLTKSLCDVMRTSDKSGSYAWDDGVRLGEPVTGGFDYDDKYIVIKFSGIPDKLSCSYSGGSTGLVYQVYQSADGSSWGSPIINETKAGSATKQLSQDTRYLKFLYSGNFAGTFRDITVTELKTFSPSVSELDFGENQMNVPCEPKQLSLSYANVGHNITLTTNDAHFTVEPTSITSIGGEKTGTYENIKVSYSTNEVHTSNGAKLIIQDELGNTAEVALTASTAKQEPTITWVIADQIELGSELTPEEVATNANDLTITFSSDNEEVIQFEDGVLKAIEAGEATITAHITGDETFTDKDFTKKVTVTSKQIQTITWDQNLTGLRLEGETVTLTASASSGLTCTYESSDPNVVSVSGSTLTIVGEGEAIVTAYQEGNGDWAAATPYNNVVRVIDPNKPCLTEGTIAGQETYQSSSKEFPVEIPSSISFSAKKDSWLVSQNFYIDQWVDNKWDRIYEGALSTDYPSSSTVIGSDKVNYKATKIRVGSNAGLGHTCEWVKCTYETHTNLSTSSIQFATSPGTTPPSQTFTVDNSNRRLTLSCANSRFTISPTSIGECGICTNETITVSYTAPDEPIKENADLILADLISGETIAKVTLSASVVKQSQTLTHNIGTAYQATDVVNIEVSASSGLTDFNITATPNDVVTFNGNQMTFNKSCDNLSITIAQPGDKKWNAVSTTINNIKVSKVNPTIVTKPTATIQYGEMLTSALLTGGEVSATFRGAQKTVSGSFNLTSQPIYETAGDHEYDVTFTPSGTEANYYNAVTGKAVVTVTKAPATLEVKDYPNAINVFIDDTKTPKIDLVSCIVSWTANSDTHGHAAQLSAINYACATEGAVITDDKKFYATKAGTYTITASADATDYYQAPDSKTFTISVIKSANTISFKVNGQTTTETKVNCKAFVTMDVQVMSNGALTITPSGKTNGITPTINGNQITFAAEEGSSNKSVTFTISQAATEQYEAAQGTFTVKVNPIYYLAAQAERITIDKSASSSTHGGTATASVTDAFIIKDYLTTEPATTHATYTATTNKGYRFDGWFDNDQCNGTPVSTNLTYETEISSTLVEQTYTKTLYAHWTKLYYTKTNALVATGGSGQVFVQSGTPSANPNWASESHTETLAAPFEDHQYWFYAKQDNGYIFKGWSANQDGSNIISGSNVEGWNIAITEASPNPDEVTNITRYAVFTPKHYTFTFNANGGSAVSESVEVTINTACPALPATVWVGHNFEGWYLPDGTTRMVVGQIITDLGEDGATIELTAHWTTQTYQLTLDPDGGSVTQSSVMLTYGAKLPTLNDNNIPSREGYGFAGYYTEKQGKGTQYYDGFGKCLISDPWTKAEGLTLYARWSLVDEITWNEGKALNFYAKDQIPSNVAVAKSGLAVTYESKDETIVKVENGTKLSAISAGTVNIVARTQGDFNTAPCQSEVTFTIDRRPQSIKWDQSFVHYVTTPEGTIDAYSEVFNAVAMDGLKENVPSGCSISYSVPVGQSVAEIKDGKLHLIGEGETTITAIVAQTSEYEAFSLEKMVRVRKFGENCGSFVLEELKEKAIGSKSGFEYSYNKPGAKLSFKARKLSAVFTLDANVIVSGYDEVNKAWTEIGRFNLNHADARGYSYDINESYRKVRFATDADLENDYRYISEVYITQASYLRTESATIDEKVSINQDYVKEIKVSFSDIPPVVASITNNTGANLTLKPIRVSLNGEAEKVCTEATNDCKDYGYYVYQLSGSWEDPHKYEEQITFTTSLGETQTVNVKLDVDMLGQMTFDNHNETARWSDPKNWYYGGHDHGKLPTASHSVEIDQNVIVDCEANVYNLKIYAHDGVYPEVRIAPQGGLTIQNGGISVGDKCSVVIESSKEKQGYLRVSPKWANGQGERYSLPTATVQLATRGDIEAAQKVDGKQDAQWQYMGFPVEAMGYNVDYITWLYEWNEAQGWIDKKAESDASPEKKAAVQPFTGYALTQYGTPVLEFNGRLINSDVTIPFTYNPNGLGGQNMFANSYPSPIDVKCFTQDDVPSDAGAMDFTFYLYNTGTWADWYDHGTTKERAAATPGTFTAIPMLSASLLDNYQTLIPSMQGVCVQVYKNETYVKLDYKKHVWYAYERANTVDDMNQPQRVALYDNTSLNAEVEEDMRVRDSIRQSHENQKQALTHRAQIIVNSENSGSTSVYLLEKADFTKGYDNGYDAPLMGTFGVVNLYTTEEDGLMAVSASNDLDGTFVGFLSGEDTNYELSISSVIGDSLQLMDVQTGDVFDVKDGATYSFMATPNYEDDYRFRIIKAENTPVVPTGWTGLSDKAKIWYNKQVLYITDADANSVAFIYSAAGELLKQVTFNHNTTISTTDLPEGVYTVRVEDSVLKFFVKH